MAVALEDMRDMDGNEMMLVANRYNDPAGPVQQRRRFPHARQAGIVAVKLAGTKKKNKQETSAPRPGKEGGPAGTGREYRKKRLLALSDGPATVLMG